MGASKTYNEARHQAEQKLQQSIERLEQLSDWLYEHTASIGAQYENHLAEYNTALRRYDSLTAELDRYNKPSKHRDNSMWAIKGWEARNKINY